MQFAVNICFNVCKWERLRVRVRMRLRSVIMERICARIFVGIMSEKKMLLVYSFWWHKFLESSSWRPVSRKAVEVCGLWKSETYLISGKPLFWENVPQSKLSLSHLRNCTPYLHSVDLIIAWEYQSGWSGWDRQHSFPHYLTLVVPGTQYLEAIQIISFYFSLLF